MFKKENGITLVALVVTIIVLLILAGVSISMISGDDGIATQASNASKATDLGNAKDAMDLAVSTAKTDYYATFANGTPTEESKPDTTNEILSYVRKQGYNIVSPSDAALLDGGTFDIAEGKDGTTAAYTVTVTMSSGIISGVTVTAK